MIKISVAPKRYKVKIKGHAKFSEIGTDIICASVSFSFYNLSQVILNFYEAGMLCKEPELSDNPGNATLEVMPKAEYEAHVQLALAYFTEGMRMLDAQYPEYVSLKVTEK
jgi:uncharacterized protein YsxB (DUF464 family)